LKFIHLDLTFNLDVATIFEDFVGVKLPITVDGFATVKNIATKLRVFFTVANHYYMCNIIIVEMNLKIIKDLYE
jgi:hypothetical protein